MAEQQLIIVGASARAAAFSALRAGMRPWCADLFADADLRAVCPVTRIDARSYPNGFERILKDAPDAPWIYTGGLENHPKSIDRLASIRPLWGNGGEVLRAVRDPVRLMQTFRAAGLMYPESRLEAPEPRLAGHWLEKPLGGAGGSGIRVWRGNGGPSRRRVYYQQFVSGLSVSAVFAAIAGQSTLLGVTEQLVGERWLHAGRFQYCGSIGPLPVHPEWRAQLRQIGSVLATEFGLRGLFGVDAVVADGQVWPIEVNPRYTASMEVLEHDLGICTLDWHRRAFAEGGSMRPTGAPPLFAGKAILFAKQAMTFPENSAWRVSGRGFVSSAELPPFADIPDVGTPFAAGQPVFTLFSEERTIAGVQEQLRRNAQAASTFLFRARESPRERET